MTINTHYAIWDCLEKCYPDDIENIKGVQIYLNIVKKMKLQKKK